MSANMGTFVLMSLLFLAVSPAVEGQSAMSAAVATNTLKAALPTPNKAVDIIFALDRSGSVGSSNYNKIIDFVKAVLSHFSVSPTTTRVAVVSFGTDAKVEFDLLRWTSNNNNKCELLRTYIPKLKYTGGGTNTIGALNLALALLKKPGVRSTSTKVVFTITDGKWNVGGDPSSVVRTLQARGVYMYAFGVGAWGISSSRLRGLGNKDSHGHKYVYLCLDFNVLSQVAKRLRGDHHKTDYLPSYTTRCYPRCNHATRSCQCDVYGGNYACVCQKGYDCGNRRDTKCPLNSYKDTIGTGPCISCPTNSLISRTGATSKTECKCKAGYQQVGSPIQRCKRITCSRPSYDTTAVRAVSCVIWTNYGDRCSLDCQSGYVFVAGEKVLTCGGSGTWNGTPLSCKKVTCPILTAPQDGSIGPCGNRYGDTCTFQCDYSFKLSGSATTTCTAAGSWSHPTPRCSKLSCQNSEIADPSPNGVRVCPGSHTEVGHSCSVTCNTGYQPRGQQVSTCRAVNGVAGWDRRPQACQVDRCTPLTDPSDGTVSPVLCKTSPEYNTQCTYGCNKQYTLHGPTSKTCEPGGVWSSTDVNTCRDEKDPIFPNCPSDITAVAPSQKTDAEVSWLVPVATDNSGSTPTVDVDITTSLGPVNFLQRTPPIWFPEGQYTVTYTATDQGGNRATCDFSIHVQGTSERE
ncbi:sushi, von Willebrand factor type A, EGF and pentraxin domain-containing protein 1-like [Branchiostoma floridae]|uniref:Sushi, von Willebrand factor type A, EGF and pentraxin domain-containing protein 1-like n=1 Tax=Branchiostoma floridae TaxID=7739 RepID=A0A9J7LBF5_BRAFL|nr:sushi, von Willebrand factor type A, EGF and pentraxin domain-containing protein 1-like [Branchiostoma floridae]